MRMLISLSLAVALACYMLFAYVTLDRRGDDARIRSLIEDTVTAINKRDLGGTMRSVSESFRDYEDLNKDRLRMLVAQALRAEPEFAASAKIRSLVIERDSATVEVAALVKNKIGESIYDRSLILNLRRENARHALIMPTKAWRVVGARNLGLAGQF